MSQLSSELYIPPYAGVRLLECRDHFQLSPVLAVRTFYGYGKIKTCEATCETEDGKVEAIWDDDPNVEIWAVLQWFRFDDGHEEQGGVAYLRPPHTEEDARKKMKEMEEFYSASREEVLSITHIFRATEEDFAYIDENYPNYQSPPTDPKAIDEYDVYQARLKVMAGLQPITVELIKIADVTKDPEKRQRVEREAVQTYFAELAHYWTEAEVLAWQRSNPVGTGWMCEFANVYHKRRRDIDSVNHELALNWLRRKYNLLTAKELSDSIFQRTLKWLTPDALKKRRDWLGLAGKRPSGPREKSGSQ
jgi:hypothetical protein